MSIITIDPALVPAFRPEDVLVQFLDSDGDGGGTINMNGTYTLGEGDGVFYIQPPANKSYLIERVTVIIEDTAIQSAQYGGVTALTNGCLFKVTRGGVTKLDLTAGQPIKSNDNWAQLTYTARESSFGTGNEFVRIMMHFPDTIGGALLLDGDLSDQLKFVCQDTLTGLVQHTIMAQGLIVDNVVRTNN